MDLCQQYSRRSSRTYTNDGDIFSQAQKSANRGDTRENNGNLLENDKMDMMSSISSQLNVMREKQKQVDEYLVLGVLFPKCRKKHPLREFPLDKVEVCGLCELEQYTKYYPSLLKAKALFQASTVDTKHVCFIVQKKLW